MCEYKEIKVTDPMPFSYIEKTDNEGVVSFIPMVEGNSDYQAYLNKDKPVEHFTPNV
jgi:hypothetical protein